MNLAAARGRPKMELAQGDVEPEGDAADDFHRDFLLSLDDGTSAGYGVRPGTSIRCTLVAPYPGRERYA